MPAAPRQLTLQALLEWEKGKAFSDEILHTLFQRQRVQAPQRAFVRETFFGVLRNLSRLDFLVEQLLLSNGTSRRTTSSELDARTQSLLRLGLYQLFHLRVASHAAVNETVALGGKARGLINAVLRRALREQPALEAALIEAPPHIRLSHPAFLLEGWQRQYGDDAVQALCEWDNRPAEVFARVNGLKTTTSKLLQTSPDAQALEGYANVLRMRHLPTEWLEEGLCYVQDPSTLMACEMLDPQPGETVLDACAAPGGKTTYLAEKMQNSGRLVACDQWESRVQRLTENLERLGVTNAEVHLHDSMQLGGPMKPASFDRVLVDAPCTNTGVLRRRVDVRWRLTEEDSIRMPVQQLALLRRAFQVVKRGGAVVYSTCSLERQENEDLIDQVLHEIPGVRLLHVGQKLPFRDGTDGAFAALLTLD